MTSYGTINMTNNEGIQFLDSRKKQYILGFAVLGICLVVTITCAVELSKDKTVHANGYCRVITTNQSSPLLIEPGTTTLIYPPPGSNAIQFSPGQFVEFACPGKQVKAYDRQLGSNVTAVCKKDGSFSINGIVVMWRGVSCSSIPVSDYCKVITKNPMSPLLMEPGTTTIIYPPPGSNIIRFSPGQSVEFACPGKQVKAFDKELGSNVTAVCKKNGNFSINDLMDVTWDRVSCSSIPVSNYCKVITTNQLSPLLIKPGTTTLMYPPPGSNAIRFSPGQSVELACPGMQVKALNKELGSIVTAVCKKDGSFSINDLDVAWDGVSCSSISGPVVKKWKNEDLKNDFIENCFKEEGTIMGSIGFNLNETRYLSSIDICFDTKTSLALYSRYDLPASVHDRVANVSTPSFQADKNFYPLQINVNDLYKKDNIKVIINQILGLDPSDPKYINDKMFINRGHLAPKADFYYAPLQLATYRYINVAPQWESFNGGNWNDIEISVRNYAFNNKVDLKIWTGVYGIASLQNKSKIATDLYLYELSKKRTTLFPVPEIFWKLVYDPKKQKAVVLIGHNNPYETFTKPIYCEKDVKLSWSNWDAKNIIKGYSYACNYNDVKLKKTITYLPDIPVKGLL